MKNIVVFLLVFVIGIVGFCWSDVWNYTVVDDDINTGLSPHLELDSNGHPHISYGTGSYHPYQLRYAKWDGDIWHIEVIGSLFGGSSISLNSYDYPYIAHAEYYWGAILCIYWDGNNWNDDLIVENLYDWSFSIDIDSEDNPHIAFYSEDFDTWETKLNYAYKEADEWIIETVDDEGDVGRYCSIEIDSDDNVHILYVDDTNSRLKYARLIDDFWEITQIDKFFSTGFSFKLDSNDLPHISFRTYGQDPDKLMYARYDGSEWSVDVVDDGGNVGFSNSLAIDAQDNPHIAYFEGWYPDYSHLRYAYFDGYNWEIERVDRFPFNHGVSIEMNHDNKPCIAYCDSSTPGYEILKYAWYGPDNEINLTTFSAESTNSNSINLNWSCETTEGEHIEGFNLYRREMGLEEDSVIDGVVGTKAFSSLPIVDEDWSQINSSLITGQNPYSYIDDTVDSGNTYEYRLEAVVEDSPETLGTTTGTCGLPKSFEIASIHPNPATDEVTITLSTPESVDVMIEVYDITGRVVKTLSLGDVETGEHTEVVNTSDLSSGVYTVKATAGVVQSTKRMVVVR